MSDAAKGGRGLAIILAASIALAGCATNAPKPSELNAGIRKVAFVQHGTGPLRYEARAVDGKTFWAGSSNVNFVPATSARADAQMPTWCLPSRSTRWS